jgi:hypothetical protein
VLGVCYIGNWDWEREVNGNARDKARLVPFVVPSFGGWLTAQKPR